jgi:hypothetical protein
MKFAAIAIAIRMHLELPVVARTWTSQQADPGRIRLSGLAGKRQFHNQSTRIRLILLAQYIRISCHHLCFDPSFDYNFKMF